MKPMKFSRVLDATLGLCVFTCAALAATLFWEPGPAAALTPKEATKGVPRTAPATPGKQGVQLPAQAPGINPETFRMIESIEKKNRELKRREEELHLKEQQLKVLEEKIRADLAKIEEALARSEEQLGIQNERIRDNINALVKAYSSMKPDEAAALVEALDENLAIKILAGMRSKVAGKILSRLDVKTAKNISEKMAGQKKKPAAKKGGN